MIQRNSKRKTAGSITRKSHLKLATTDGKRAASYLRKSTDEQAESLPQQREAVRAYAARHGYSLIAEYCDAGISGVDSTDRRPQFIELIAAAEAGEFDFVICWDLSRLTRSDPMETAAELRPLRRTGVKVATTDRLDPIDWDTFAGQLLLSIEAESNNSYVRKMARNTTRGQWEKAKKGLWVAGRPPLGYVVNRETDRLEPGDPADVAAIRWVFEACDDGASLRNIIAGARKRGIKRSLSWLCQTLSNRLYVGDFVWGRNTQARFWSVRDGQVTEDFQVGKSPDGEEPAVVIPGNHPAIIDRDLFERIQILLEARKRGTTPLRDGGGFILSGLMRCFDCGAMMIGMTDREKKLYRCGGYMRSEGCHSHIVDQAEVLDHILLALEQQFTPAKIKEARRILLADLERHKAIDSRGALSKRREGVQAKLDKASRRLVEVDSDLLQVVQDQIRQLKAELREIDTQLDYAGQDRGSVVQGFDDRILRATDILRNLRKMVQHADPVMVRSALQGSIQEVRVKVDQRMVGKRVRYKFVGGEILLREESNLSGSSWKSERVVAIVVAG